MDDEVLGHFLCSDISDVFKNSKTLSFSLSNEQPRMDLIETRMETVTEANDVLKNGILIETSKGVEWLSLTDALTSGVGGLNLSVEDFQHVAAQLLSSSQQQQSLPVTSVIDTTSKLESIAEVGETILGVEDDVLEFTTIEASQKVLDEQIRSDGVISSENSSSVGVSESTNSDSSVQSTIPPQVKKKGGWPKGRKRKPELLENRPPKAPSTGYVLYLNEKRKLFKDMPFPEVTKLLGNEWSKLSLEEKRDYLERAELDKKRYREELRIYRKSEAYQSYLRRKRIKSLQANGTEESDVDATDELDDEDNEELYCRACDQWFTTLHNKKEHLYGRQHFQSISQLDQHSSRDGSSCYSFDESSLDGVPVMIQPLRSSSEPASVTDAISNVFHLAAVREKEIKFLQKRLAKTLSERTSMMLQLQELKQLESALKKTLLKSKEEKEKIEQQICNLWDVPSLFVRCQDYLLEDQLEIE
ncbi:uncharacterized protein LOC142324725 [Lycorma delicatula]|uniref:uncharacterized protein LOC142324725 n=1 Tax=Lycorma delicatula TaxID=130591 RepID=UPI003F5122F1